MGARGPAPKRSDARIRRNTDYRPITPGESGKRTEAPYLADESWHPLAIETWEALQNSGQSAFYEPSDWIAAFFMCEAMSRELKPQFLGQQSLPDGSTRPFSGIVPIKGSSLSAFRAMQVSLNMTEVDRRRASMELAKGAAAGGGPAATPGQTARADARRRLQAVPDQAQA